MSEEVKKYRPSNATVGDAFMAEHCAKCQNHTEESPCMILANTMAFGVDDEQYPDEWRYVDEKPTCTAFRHSDAPAKKYHSKAENQLELI